MAIKRLSKDENDADDIQFDEFIQSKSEDITELQGDIDAELNSITSEFGKDKNEVDFKIKLMRVLERKGEREWLFDILPSELPVMDRVKEEYGGGKYEASVFKNGKLYRKFNFNIATPRQNFVMPKSPTTDITQLIAIMNAQEEKRFAQLKELLVNRVPATPTIDPMQMMGSMVAMMVQMKNLMPAPVVHDNNNQIEFLLKGLEIARDFGGSGSNGGGGESTMMDVVRDLIKSPLLGSAISAVATQAQPIVNKPVENNLRLDSPKQNISNQDNTGGQKVNPFISSYLNMLVKKAAQDADTGLYAEYILDNMPENLVREYIVRDDLLDFLATINPDAKNYHPWFLKLKNDIIELLLSADDEPLTENSDSADMSVNGHNTKSVDGDS